MLYPLKFTPILKERIWGGDYLYKKFGKGTDSDINIGESWEVSAVKDNVSVVSEGILAGNDLFELIEVYMGDLVGDKVYEKFGVEFPVLVKFLVAKSDVSIQVHPNEEYANEKFGEHGKAEMWYIFDAEKDAKIIAGFDRNTSREEVEQAINNDTITQLLRIDDAQKGDVFDIPVGRVHAICKDNVIVEIQQTSDLTFRIYDYDRVDDNGNKRDLHVQQSLDVLDFNAKENYKIPYNKEINEPTNLIKNEHFTTNLLSFDKKLGRDYYLLDSYVVLVCTEGEFDIEYKEGGSVNVKVGESVLLPACIQEYYFNPKTEKATFIETYLEL